MKKFNVEAHQVEALYAYLELCNAIGEVPRKEVYTPIKECRDVLIIERSTRLIELEHSKFEKETKELQEKEQLTKKSILSEFFSLFKKKS